MLRITDLKIWKKILIIVSVSMGGIVAIGCYGLFNSSRNTEDMGMIYDSGHNIALFNSELAEPINSLRETSLMIVLAPDDKFRAGIASEYDVLARRIASSINNIRPSIPQDLIEPFDNVVSTWNNYLKLSSFTKKEMNRGYRESAFVNVTGAERKQYNILVDNFGALQAKAKEKSSSIFSQALRRAKRAITVTILLAAATAIINGFLCFWIVRLITKPLAALVQFTSVVKTGDTSKRLHLDQADEIGILANSFDDMADKLEQREKERLLAERALYESETKMRAIFLNAFQLFGLLSPEGKLLECNKTALDVISAQPKDVIGKYFWDTPWWNDSPDKQERLRSAIRKACQGEMVRFETTHSGPDAGTLDIDYSITPVRDASGQVILLIPEGRDITERKLAETKLREAILQAESANKAKSEVLANMSQLVDERTHDLLAKAQELEEANQSLNEARLKADAANSAKSDFLARMSHEIRTPMNAIIGLTDLTLKTELDETQRNFLSKARDSANHLLSIINDILDFSKIEAGKFDLSPTNFWLNQLFDELGDMFVDRAAAKHLELSLLIDNTVPLALVGDAVRLRQVLINLLGNAIKFTEAGYVILGATLLPDVAKSEAGTVRLHFSIQDTGIGIPKEKLAELFTPFTQIEGAMTRRFGGTGLGLSISKRLVELMKGEIQAESELGRGSNFSFTVELAVQPREVQRTLMTPADLRGKKALVVDDNEAALLIYSEMISSLYLLGETASSGEEALTKLVDAAARDAPFDLVLLDWNMDGMDGISAAKKIRGLPELAACQPAILLTTMYGRDTHFQRLASQEKALDGLLFKPISSSELFNAIVTVFGQPDAAVPHKPAREEVADTSSLANIRGAKVLLVEDNLINQEVATIMLNSLGLFVDIADNGREAVDRVIKLAEEEKAPYDAVLMDIQMPEMDGYEATRILRRDGRFKSLPIIAMTAHALKGDREECLAAGMNDYVSKPIDEQALFLTLLRWIEPRKQGANENGTPTAGPGLSPSVGLPSFLPCVDIKDGLARCKGNTLIYSKMLAHFAATNKDAADAIKRSLDAGNYSEAERLVHSIKGNSGNLGLTDVYGAARMLDDALKTQRLAAVSNLFDVFAQALSSAVEAISSLDLEPREADDTGDDQPLDREATATTLRTLIRELEMSSSRSRHSFDALRRLLRGHGYDEELKRLEGHLYALDTDNALLVATDLNRTLDMPFRKTGEE